MKNLIVIALILTAQSTFAYDLNDISDGNEAKRDYERRIERMEDKAEREFDRASSAMSGSRR